MADIPTEFERGLSGGYRLERELGHGGMATVWLAWDLKHERPVALKVLHPELASLFGPERFQREIRLAGRLQHPHILPVFDSGESAGRLWFTMPYVEGQSLRERLTREGTIPTAEALRIAREAAQALQYAHDHGVIHRDIKPENILLTGDGSSLVADFGIARSRGAEPTQSLTATGFILGTPAYMSPEQASGESEIDGRSDLYSLACVLYEMLSGKPPFSGPTAQAILAKQITERPDPLDGAGTGLPQPVARAIARALAKDPAERFATAAEFAAALDAARASVGAAGSRRRRVLALALGAVALLGIGWLGYRSRSSGALLPAAGGAVASGFNRTLTQLTFGEGVEEWPAWSPDGKRLAYVAEVNGFRQLFERTVATGQERRITHGTRDDIQPAWSPDGRRLAFVRAKSDRGKLEPGDINGWYREGGQLWTIDLASDAETALADDAFDPAWSPDGSSLAFDAPWAGPQRIWIADAGGRNPRQVTSDSSEAVVHTEPRWSPDGKTLVFRRIEKTTSDIALVSLATRAVIRLTDDNVLDLDPAWSPDGKYIYFSSSRGGGLNLWRIPVGRDGRSVGAVQQFTTGAGDDVQPAIAPDGRRLAFEVRGINSDIWRLPVSPQTGRPTGPAEPVAASSRVESRSSWSPDGRLIAFNSDRLGEMNIWLRDLGSGAERQLTSGPGGDYQPNWSPDGSSIVFFSGRAGHLDIWAARVADGRLTRLTTDGAMHTNPFYSPDGRRIAFLSDQSGRLEVWLMQADGSAQRRLTSIGAGGHFLRWTRDGRAIVFRAERGSTIEIYRVSAEDGTMTRLPDVASGAHMSFSPDQSLILDVRGHKVLWIHPVDGKAPYEIFHFPDPDIRIDYPVWSPDGRWVLFDRAAPRGGDIWLLEGAE